MSKAAEAEKPECMYENADMEVKYYDMLYKFAGVVTRANEQSFEGRKPEDIAARLRKSVEAFCSLYLPEYRVKRDGAGRGGKVVRVCLYIKNMRKYGWMCTLLVTR